MMVVSGLPLAAWPTLVAGLGSGQQAEKPCFSLAISGSRHLISDANDLLRSSPEMRSG